MNFTFSTAYSESNGVIKITNLKTLFKEKNIRIRTCNISYKIGLDVQTF